MGQYIFGLSASYSSAIAKEVNSVLCMTEIFESEKKKKKNSGRTHIIVVVITFFLLSSHVASHLPIRLKFSQSTLPLYFSPSHVLSRTTILYFSFILCGSCGLLVYETPNISCEFTVVF